MILGAQGVALNTTLLGHIARIEEHNRTIRQRENALPSATRGTLTIDQFCALPNEDNIDDKIAHAERGLAAARNAQAIQTRGVFLAPTLPVIDAGQINAVLGNTIADVHADAMARVRQHLSLLGKEGEEWVGRGMSFIPAVEGEDGTTLCPFCEQDLATSQILQHYQAYFSEAYEALKTTITDSGKTFSAAHQSEMQSAFERSVRELSESRTFWGAYIAMPEFALDTAVIMRSWNAARDLVLRALRAKFSAPLDVAQLSDETLAAIREYDNHRHTTSEAVAPIVAKNDEIAMVKEQAAGTSVGTAAADLARLNLIKVRRTHPVDGLCQAYLDEKVSKTVTEGLRDAARDALDDYRQNIFPVYQQAINDYLQRFGAGFRVDAVNSVNTRGGSSCTYNVVINQVAMPVTANQGVSFRNTLSAGDRNTLALAFFFASLEQNPQLANAIVVIDDPMTSLDEHRSVATVQQIRLLLARVQQVIVLSHFKPYLCEVWNGANASERSAFLVRRDGQGSSIAEWNVRQDCITEHDKNHAVVAEFVRTGDPALERQAATALRPMLEAYLRVAYPEDFPPGMLIGPFITKCTPRAGTATEILDQANIIELQALKDYGNHFHHDTNLAWQTQQINGQELTGFCRRVIQFTRR